MVERDARASEFADDDPPSHYTSLGGFHAVRAVANHIRGTDDLNGLKVAVQGVGQTGADLIAQLIERGADVIAADVNAAVLAEVSIRHGIETASPDDIHAQNVDIFAPCAMGGILNEQTIPQLKCKGIAGLANNQLATPEDGQRLLDRGIAYAPDFVANAGGVMRATLPIFSTPDRAKALPQISGRYERSAKSCAALTLMGCQPKPSLSRLRWSAFVPAQSPEPDHARLYRFYDDHHGR